MFGSFTEEARQIIVHAKQEMSLLKHPYVGSEHLLLAILKDDNVVSKKLKDYGLTYDSFRDEIVKVIGVGTSATEWFLYTPLLKRIMESAVIDSKENNNGCVTISHLFTSLLEEGEGVAIRIIIGMNIDVDKLYSDFSYKFTKKVDSKLMIDELGLNLNLGACNFDPVIGREKEIKRVIEILCRRTKNNPILIGEAGVGKTAIVEELSKRIVLGDVPVSLRNKKIISLDMASLVAGTKYRGEFEDRVRKVLSEVEDNNDIILFIDEIHTLVGAGGAEGAIDASNIFKPALARGKIRCIGATTTFEYKKFIRNDSALDRRFQVVSVDIPNMEQTRDILFSLKPTYEKFHGVRVSNDIIDLITSLSHKYVYGRFEPDRSIDILDEVCSYVSLKESRDQKKYSKMNKDLSKVISNKKESIVNQDFKKAFMYKNMENKIMNDINNLELSFYKDKVHKKVTRDDVAHVLYERTSIPIYELLGDQDKVISELESSLRDSVVGQESAVKCLVDVAKRIKLGFKDGCCSLMFCGPTGVGKTSLASVFGKCMTGNVIRLDMSEYIEPHSVSKLIGTSPGYVGYDDNRFVFEEIKNRPYSVLILDEIERAHPNVVNLFLQILDNGKIKDSRGDVIRFDNVIIIMTSNIGFGEAGIGFNSSKSRVVNKLKEYFSVPFLNRIDSVVVFDKLTRDDVYGLVEKKIFDIKRKYLKNIDFKIDNCVIDEIVSESNFDEFGARRIDKIIKEKVESQIIDKIIDKEDKIHISKLTC